MSETIKKQNENAKPRTVRAIPETDVDLGVVSLKVAKKWILTPQLTLLWTDSNEFSRTASDYDAEISGKMSIASARPEITNTLRKAEKKMNEGIAYIKIYLNEKYKIENAPSYYPAFGLVYRSRSYRFPTDQNGRIASLKLMLQALDKHGFKDKEYGTGFWKSIQKEYELLVTEASAKDGEVSNKVGSKNVLKKALKKTLNSIILIIKGNYPDTYKQELRAWGFQKEKY